ncbi:MAG TPA: hypothetical protein VHB68_02230 [Steroidobacteraceae bacterium]|nr:hypothetical protein [Steroidobacteraceae bacterium]
MEAVAMDKLIEKGEASLQLAQAIGEALDITLKAANFITVPVLDARFTQFEAKMEARFGAIEKTMEARFSVFERTMEARFGAIEKTMEARFGVAERTMEIRFGGLERALETTKAWAVLLYAGLAIVFFGALTVDHRWLISRQDQVMVRIDARFAQEEARTDKLIAAEQARTDRLIAQQQAHTDQVEARLDTKLDQLRALLMSDSRKPGRAARFSTSP